MECQLSSTSTYNLQTRCTALICLSKYSMTPSSPLFHSYPHAHSYPRHPRPRRSIIVHISCFRFALFRVFQLFYSQLKITMQLKMLSSNQILPICYLVWGPTYLCARYIFSCRGALRSLGRCLSQYELASQGWGPVQM